MTQFIFSSTNVANINAMVSSALQNVNEKIEDNEREYTEVVRLYNERIQLFKAKPFYERRVAYLFQGTTI